MLGASQIWAAVAISGTSSALFSADFMVAVLGFLPIPTKRSFFTGLGFEVDGAHSRHGGLSRKRNATEEDDAQGWLPFI